ncbi:MAG: hypothetical protein EBR33_04490 [Synechococcaceae bacterium WB4_1_0192]|jgi:hypothetical protein|nr:hypothetical protein [Synechococcaceae bacterium WB4_1_0192]
MIKPALMAAGLLSGSLALVPPLALAESSSTSSRISEVDACNQAQYLMPESAVVQRFRLQTRRDREGARFDCTVIWSRSAKTAPSYRPILFPNQISIPLLGSGWL